MYIDHPHRAMEMVRSVMQVIANNPDVVQIAVTCVLLQHDTYGCWMIRSRSINHDLHCIARTYKLNFISYCTPYHPNASKRERPTMVPVKHEMANPGAPYRIFFCIGLAVLVYRSIKI